MKQTSKRILFFDGVCNLCNNLVNFTLPKFKKNEIFFASLQGTTAKAILPPQDLSLDYVVYYRKSVLHRKSEAIAYLFIDMGGVYYILGIMLRAIPLVISNWIYKLIATNRYRLFGQRDICRLPSPQEKDYFLE